MTVIFVGLMMAMIAVIWGINKWYLEEYYIKEKVASIEAAYDAFNWQLEANAEQGISIQEAMKREQDADGNIKEGNLQKLFRDFSDKANVSMLMIDNSADSSAVYSTARDAKFLRDRMERYIFGKNHMDVKVLEENEAYTLQVTFDPWRDGSYLESWGFFSDNSTAFIMSTPLSSISESTMLSNRFLAYVGIFAVLIGGIVVYFVAGRLTGPINQLSRLSEKMSQLDFDARYEPEKGEYTEIGVLGKNMNTLSMRLRETIGELKSVNNQLQKDIEEKTRIDEMRKEFIANVSHELKTPITSIKGFAELLCSDMPLGGNKQEAISKRILKETMRMSSLISDIIMISRLESGDITFEREVLDLAAVVSECCSDAAEFARSSKVSISCTTQPCVLSASHREMSELAGNLITNAVKYNRQGGRVEVNLTNENGAPCLRVFNTGEPIAPEYAQRIFERFYRIDKGRSRKQGGTGLGLAIVKNAVAIHGGTITARERERGGLEFVFTLKKHS